MNVMHKTHRTHTAHVIHVADLQYGLSTVIYNNSSKTSCDLPITHREMGKHVNHKHDLLNFHECNFLDFVAFLDTFARS